MDGGVTVRPRPERGVEYGGFPTEEFRAARQLEAAASLGQFLGIETRCAADLLEDTPALVIELRAAAADPLRQLRKLRRRYADPSMLAQP